MSEKIYFEVQDNADNLKPRPRRAHEWMRTNQVENRNWKTIEEARKFIKSVQKAYARDWMKAPSMRIVKVTVVTTYEIVE